MFGELSMIGRIFITRSGYDPEKGKHVKDPTLGPLPTLGACRPDIRRRVVEGDHIFVISGKVRGAAQYVIGGFEVAQKIDAMTAYRILPEQRLHRRDDGQLDGNIIVDARGNQHRLDNHRTDTFEKRITDYVVGRNPVALTTPEEIALGREQTLEVLRNVFRKPGGSPFEVVGRWGSPLSEDQVMQLRDWLHSLKQTRRSR
jgi:hypothetical protein